MALRVLRDVVALEEHGKQFIDNNAGVLVVQRVVFGGAVRGAIAVPCSVLDITNGPWRSYQPHAFFDVESNMAKANFVAFEVNRYPSVQSCEHACTWFRIQTNLGLAHNTLQAYGRALNDFLAFTGKSGTGVVAASREHISAWVRDLLSRPNNRSNKAILVDSGVGLSNATLQQRITAVRLFYDFLIEEGMRSTNPVGRGRYTARKGFASKGER